MKKVGLVLFGSLLACQAASANPLEEALSAYVEGLRTGNVKTLEKLSFWKEGQFCLNGAAGIECSSFAAVLPIWAAKPDPERAEPESHGGHRRLHGQRDLRATVRRKVLRRPLLLYIQEGHWVVVAKTTFNETEPT